ncbi:HAMP domain-containing sensor histidine kinase [Aerococcus sp. 1KP-2016]|uniref:sensor histidine kinase n=1 Tax=Aerococcus sp. 1KP-2016 TaxID=1981982 RepID=UPI000B9938C5|nr:HAMP domain-containing sensor histidine kinase [Aerococcus sp. 1KP-2016]OYQ67515.1 two-component sensor histidine kinase [Aerococcus sp. 1KP-2016]
MKLNFFYQQILSFLVVIAVTIAAMGVTLFSFSRDQVLLRQEQQLNDIAKFVGGQTITTDFLASMEPLLSSSNMKLFYFDANNNLLYPTEEAEEIPTNQLSDEALADLQNGKPLGLQSFEMGFAEKNGDALAIFMPLTSAEDQSYAGYLVLGVPSSQSDAIIDNLMQNVLKGIAIALIIAVLFSVFIAGYQNKRIRRLREATQQTAQGDYSVRLEVSNIDEFDDLAEDFNQMALSLEKSEVEIDRQENIRRQLMMDVAHEIRTPLTTMIGLLEGLRQKVLPEDKIDRSVDLMYKEANRLNRLVNENLDIEKIRSNEIVLSKSNFNAGDVLRDIALQLTESAKAKHTVFDVDVPDNVPVYADYDRFHQIIFNIVQNAVQFTNDGEIYLSTLFQDGKTYIKIKDSGMGMTKDQVENIWERFYKADISRKNNEFGESGLGLSIVKQLVELHKATIHVESEAGVGTIFTLVFLSRELLAQQADAK